MKTTRSIIIAVKTVFLLYLILFSSLSVSAQEKDNYPVKNTFKGNRFVNSQSVNLASKGELYLFVQHRFGDISGGAYQFFGLDQATMRLGFDYGLTDNFNLGIGRSTYLKTLDGFLKYRIFAQTENFPVSIVLSAGASLPTIKDYFPDTFNDFSDKYSGNFKLLLAKSFNKFGFMVSPGYLNTGYLVSSGKNYSLLTLDLGASVKISNRVSANIEYMRFFENEISTNFPLSLGVDIDTGGHLFQLVLSNSQRIFNQSLYTSTPGSFKDGNFYFGFNLIREFNRKYEY